MMKRSIFPAALLFMVLTSFCTHPAGTPAQAAAPELDTTQVTMIVGGDLMQHIGQVSAAQQGDGTYNYDYVFELVKPEVSRADVAIANFEVTLGGKPYTGYPCFSAPDEYLGAAIDAGFDILLTANNHCCDRRAKGLERTIQLMDQARVPHLGTYMNAEERAKNYPMLYEKNGIRFVLLNFTYGTNGIPVPKPFVVNWQDTTEIARDIAKAKTMQPDVIIAFPHWGIEYAQLPNEEMRQLTDWMLARGVDHVIGGHPHVLQPFEVREQNGEKHLVAYSLGNYVSNQSRPNTDGGGMVKLVFTKIGDKTRLTSSGYTLHWVSRPAVSGKKNYRIYPIGYPTDKMNAQERALRQKFINSQRALFEKHNKGIKEYVY